MPDLLWYIVLGAVGGVGIIDVMFRRTLMFDALLWVWRKATGR